jgi:hypothetical protein
MNSAIRRLTVGWWLLVLSLAAYAAAVTAEQVAAAIRSSPTASAWLKANADAVGRLAMFESSGQLDVYNNTL